MPLMPTVFGSVLVGLGAMVGSLGAIVIMLYYSILHIINSLNPNRLRQEEQERMAEGD